MNTTPDDPMDPNVIPFRGSDAPRSKPQPTPGEEASTTIVSRLPGLSEDHSRWLSEDRGIDPEIAERLGCVTVTVRFRSKRTVPALLFPTIVQGQEVGWTARFDLTDRRMKGFIASPDARRHLMFGEQVWEQDYLLCDNRMMEPLCDERPERIVVVHEGQLDAMASRMAGFVGLSVPNGAKSTNWLELWAEKLATCRRVVLWFDDDSDGSQLLQACLGKLWGNIYVVQRQQVDDRALKDANDVLRALGVEGVKQAVVEAKDSRGGSYDIRPSRLYYPVTAFPLGIPEFDERMTLCAGEQTAIVGRTNRGKSKLAKWWAYNAAKKNGRRVYFQSFEEVADGELTQDLAEIEAGLPIEDILNDPALYARTLARIRQICPIMMEPALVPRTQDPMGACIARMMKHAAAGIHIHVIDNYAMVQTFDKKVDPLAQTREDILEVNEVARRYDLAVIICYHARKPPPQFLLPNRPPEIEDASGAAAIGNHCCLGVTVERVLQGAKDTNITNIAVRKARRQIHGRRCDFHAYLDINQNFRFGGDGFEGIDTGIKKRGKGKADSLGDNDMVF